MDYEKKIILEKINDLINKKKLELLNELPIIHEIDDGIIIRFFSDLHNDNEKIIYKKIENRNRPEEINMFFYLPKGTYFEFKKREYVGLITCLSGKIELDFNGKLHRLETHSKIYAESNVFNGKALENTYVLSTNNLPLSNSTTRFNTSDLSWHVTTT